MLLSISQGATILGVCTKTLRRWHRKGVFIPNCRTVGGHRRYSIERIESFIKRESKNKRIRKRLISIPPVQKFQTAAIYGRVSASKQKDDLKRQIEYLILKSQEAGFCSHIIYKDIASGLNDKRSGLKRLIRDAFAHKFSKIFITHKDRLARFGTSLIYQVLRLLNIEVLDDDIVSNHQQDSNEAPMNILVNDVLAILTSYSGKLYRLRRGAFT